MFALQKPNSKKENESIVLDCADC